MLLAVALLSSVLVAAAAGPAGASSHVEEKPLVVALCHGSNQPWPQNFPTSHFDDMFSETSGSSTVADYWRDISHGRFSIDGTLVLDVQLAVDNDAIGDRDQGDFRKCKEGVNDVLGGTDWQDDYAGPVVFKPQTEGRTVNAITSDPTDDTLQVQAAAPSVMDDWPAPPFTLVLTRTGTLWRNAFDNIENTTVTAVDKDPTTNTVTFTLDRAPQEGYRHRDEVDSDGDPDPFPSVKAWPAGTIVKTISDVYGSKNRTAVVSADTSPSVINQELGHFFGYGHSRKLSTATSGYGNCFDVMSTLTCTGHYFQVPYDYPAEVNNYPAGTLDQFNGPGMVSPFLDLNGWVAAADRTVFDPTACTQQTFPMRALGLDGSDLHQVRMPVGQEIRSGVTSEYLAVELRSKQFHWDQGIPRDAFVLNLQGDDDLPYLVDDAGAGGTSGMAVGTYHVFDPGTPSDASDDRFLFANSIDDADGTGEMTLASCPFTSAVDYTGPTSFTYGTFPDVAAGVALTNGTNAPAARIDFTLGPADCTDTIPFSDQEAGTGEATCDLEIDVRPGSHDLTARWDGVRDVFAAAEEVVAVSVARRAAALEVDEPTAVYHAAVTLSASLTQGAHPDDSHLSGIAGATVHLSLGSGADAQSCVATATSSGRASCEIDSVEQTPGPVDVTATFAGDDYYLPASDVGTITVEKRSTTLDVVQPDDTIYHDPVTLEANLQEQAIVGDPDPSPIAGAPVTLSIGPGGDQSCTATTDTDGDVTCDIASVEQTPGPAVPVTATFGGDDLYLPTTDDTTFTVLQRATELTLTGPSFAALDGSITLTGSLVEADTASSTGEPVEGREVTLALGDGADAQTCTATTDATGVATCPIDDIDQQLGPQPISAVFAGDDHYLPSSDDGELVVFEWTDGGHFVVGDGSAATDAPVTFWASRWDDLNAVSGGLGAGTASFKGFAHDPSGPTSCATDWTSLGGNSPDPPAAVPGYTAILVTDSVAKDKRDVQGSTVAVAIVHVDPGYDANPGHGATGTVVGFLCGP